jgi:hypothetical protein
VWPVEIEVEGRTVAAVERSVGTKATDGASLAIAVAAQYETHERNCCGIVFEATSHRLNAKPRPSEA